MRRFEFPADTAFVQNSNLYVLQRVRGESEEGDKIKLESILFTYGRKGEVE